jgi:hypothetical protein
MARQFVLSLSVVCFDVGLAERATSITIIRKPLLEDSVGGTIYDKDVIIGQIDHKEVSDDVKVEVDAGFNALVAHAKGDLKVMAQYAQSSYSMAYSSTHLHHECPKGTGCYIYQVQTTINTDITVYQSQSSSFQISDKPMSLVTEQVPVPEGFDMGSAQVKMVQPEERKGHYDCREISANVCDELAHNNGCRAVDDYKCSSGQKPFKWGGQSYFGGWNLPEGLCVTPYGEWKTSDWGYCHPGTEMSFGQVCATGGARYVNDWEKSNRIDSWQFSLAPGYYCKGQAVGNVSLEVEFPDEFRDDDEEVVV